MQYVMASDDLLSPYLFSTQIITTQFISVPDNAGEQLALNNL